VDISVVLNTRDRPERLALVLRCLAGQRELPGGLEVLVIDDGSTRDLSPALESLGALDVRLIRQPPLGYAVARNLGLGAAANEVVLWLDDDILFDPLFVAEHLAVHAEHEHCVVVGDRYNTYLADLDSPRSRGLVTAALAGDWAGLQRQSRRDFYARVTLRLFELDRGGQPAQVGRAS
jgi:glycosyltransferase involved in cell wall biosynthesis